MKCSRCDTYNPEGYRFCASCGRALMFKPSRPLISPKTTAWVIPQEIKKQKTGWFNWKSGKTL